MGYWKSKVLPKIKKIFKKNDKKAEADEAVKSLEVSKEEVAEPAKEETSTAAKEEIVVEAKEEEVVAAVEVEPSPPLAEAEKTAEEPPKP